MDPSQQMELTPRGRSYTAFSQPQSVPEGYRLKFTARGRPFYEAVIPEKQDDDNVDDQARGEHLRESLGFMTSLDVIERKFGIGTRLYFTFLKYIIFCNIVLLFVLFSNWAWFMSSEDSQRMVMCNFPNTDYRDHNCDCLNMSGPIGDYAGQLGLGCGGMMREFHFWEKLFVSAYTSDQYRWWFFTSVSTVGFWLAAGPVYVFLVRLTMKRHLQFDHDSIWDFNSHGNEDIIEDNISVTPHERLARRAGSYTIFVLMIGASSVSIALIQYYGTKIQEGTNNTTVAFGISFAISAIISVINFVWKIVCASLTTFERHRTWSGHRFNDMTKFLVFKLLNVTAAYVAVTYIGTSDCALQDNGIKFIELIVIDLVLMNAVELVVPPLITVMKRRFWRGHGSDESILPEFDIAEEYLEVFYRQFVLYLGSMTVPLLPLLALFTNGVEYFLDKYRMLNVCQRPKKLQSSLLSIVTWFMIATALAAIISPPNGPVFILSGITYKNRCQMWAPKQTDI